MLTKDSTIAELMAARPDLSLDLDDIVNPTITKQALHGRVYQATSTWDKSYYFLAQVGFGKFQLIGESGNRFSNDIYTLVSEIPTHKVRDTGQTMIGFNMKDKT